MSGGRYNYVYSTIESFALSIELRPDHETRKIDPKRAKFQELMLLIVQAARDIEWVDSSDMGPGDDHEAIDKVFDFIKNSPSPRKRK